MRGISGLIMVFGMVATGGPQAPAQTVAAQTVAAQTAPAQTVAGKVVGDTADIRSEKQKMLAVQSERLFIMAVELKAQVDLTNKNILSLKVVRTAEEIEALAKGMRGQAKK